MTDTQYSYQLETKFSEPTSTGEFEGLASTFGNIDLTGDIVVPGAFRDSLAGHKAAGTSPALLWHHQPDAPIGVWREMKETDSGLQVRGKLSMSTGRGREAHALMLDGALSLSIGFITKQSDFDAKGNRVLKAVDLREISAVAMPANPMARVTQVKSITDIRTFETVLREEHGFSRRAARRVANSGFRSLTDDEDEFKALAGLLLASATKF